MRNQTSAPNWPWLPSANCSKYLGEEMSLGGLLKMAVTNQTGLPTFLDLAEQGALAKGARIQGLDYVKVVANHAAPRAKELVAAGFHLLHVHALINMWGAVVTALEQTIAGCIIHDEKARQTATNLLQLNRGTPPKFGSRDIDAIASRLVQRAESPVHKGYPKLCGKFELHFEPGKYHFDDLEEVRCIRNALVHRGGIVTQQLADASAVFRKSVGKAIHLDEQSSVRHAAAMSNFVSGLLDAAIYSRYCLGPNSRPR